jgi:hypothetical protein
MRITAPPTVGPAGDSPDLTAPRRTFHDWGFFVYATIAPRDRRGCSERSRKDLAPSGLYVHTPTDPLTACALRFARASER